MIDVRSLRFRYPTARTDAVAEIDWQVAPGEFALVAGQSGSGKSTLLRCLNGLIPHFHGGYFGGRVAVFGLDTRHHPPRQLAGTIGAVFQDPETQLVTDSPEEEIAFTLENLGFAGQQARARLDAVCRELEFEHLRARRIGTLSGGEKQLVALAAALAPHPRALLLDEPTSQLDPGNARLVIAALQRLNRDAGLAIVLAEHRLPRLLPVADSVARITAGKLTRYTPATAHTALIADGLMAGSHEVNVLDATGTPGGVIVALQGLGFAYGRQPTLHGVDLDIRAGETIALTGPNGAGKTTLLKLVMGLLRPDAGRITIAGQATERQTVQEIARTVGYVPQHPTIALHQESVEDELRFTLAGLRRTGSVSKALAGVGLAGCEERHPLDLSGGERQRLAIAAITVGQPRLLLLDEPTRGLSWSMKRDLARVLRGFAADGVAIVVATHDEEFWRLFADRRLTLASGSLASDERYERSVFPQVAEDQDVTPLLTGPNLD